MKAFMAVLVLALAGALAWALDDALDAVTAAHGEDAVCLTGVSGRRWPVASTSASARPQAARPARGPKEARPAPGRQYAVTEVPGSPGPHGIRYYDIGVGR